VCNGNNIRALAAPIMFAIAGGFMFMMTVVQSSITAFTWMFILFSFFFGGPYLVIGTAIATDLVTLYTFKASTYQVKSGQK